MPDKWPRDLWLDALWEDEGLKVNERVVAYVYARYAGKHATAWASWAEVRRRTGIRSRDAVWRALKGLTDKGWLKEVQRPRQHQSAVYLLTCPVDNSAQQSGKRTPNDETAVRETDHWSADDSPGVRENVPAVRENVASSPGNRTPVLRRDLREEISDVRQARVPSDALVDPSKPHAYESDADCPGSCAYCGLLQQNQRHQIKSATTRSTRS